MPDVCSTVCYYSPCIPHRLVLRSILSSSDRRRHPARFGSTRFPENLAASSADDEHVLRAKRTSMSRVIVATDDLRSRRGDAFGGEVKLTRADHPSGERIARESPRNCTATSWSACSDEPLIVRELVKAVAAFTDPGVLITTLYRRITDSAELAIHAVKIAIDRGGFALYFSRAPIPYVRDPRGGWPPMYRHVGLYAYRRNALLVLASLEPTPLERAESLEQLRALEHGIRIKTVETAYDSFGVDTPEDLEHVRRLLAAPTPS